MKANNTSSSNNGGFKIVQRKKIWFLIPAAVAVVTAIMLTIFAFVANSPANLGVDLAGGYYISVRSTAITQDNYAEYLEEIENIASGLVDENDKNYGLKISRDRFMGEGAYSTIHISYKRIKGYSNSQITALNQAFEQAVRDAFTRVTPSVTLSGGVASISYNRTMSTYVENINLQILAEFPTADLQWQNLAPSTGTISDSEVAYATDLKIMNADAIGATQEKLIEVATINDEFIATVSEAAAISASINPDIIYYTSAAALVAIVVAFAFFAIRFKSLSAGFVVSLGLLLDVAIALCFMLIFHIEITGMIFAAMIAFLIFSVYNKAIVFDKIKDNIKNSKGEIRLCEIIDPSVNQALFGRICMLIVVTTMISALAIACAIGGVFSVIFFAVPTIFGLIASTFTSLLFTPVLWASLSTNPKKSKERVKIKKKEPKTV